MTETVCELSWLVCSAGLMQASKVGGDNVSGPNSAQNVRR